MQIAEIAVGSEFLEHGRRCDHHVDLLARDHGLQFGDAVFRGVEIVVHNHVGAEFVLGGLLEFGGLTQRQRAVDDRRVQRGPFARRDDAHDHECAQCDDDDGGDARHEEVLAEIRGFVFGGQLHENAQLRRAGVLWGGGERVDRLALRVSEPVGVRHGALLTAAPVPRNAQNTMFRLHYLNA